MFVNGEVGMMCDKSVVAYFKALSQNFPGWIDKSHEKRQSGWPGS
jgi:hypothetical protein